MVHLRVWRRVPAARAGRRAPCPRSRAERFQNLIFPAQGIKYTLTGKLGDQLQQHGQHAGACAPEVVQQAGEVWQPAAQVLPQHAQQARKPVNAQSGHVRQRRDCKLCSDRLTSQRRRCCYRVTSRAPCPCYQHQRGQLTVTQSGAQQDIKLK